MNHNDPHQLADRESSADSVADAIAAAVVILCIVAMGIFWVSGL